MLAQRLEAHGTAVWLVNTGWTGGGCAHGAGWHAGAALPGSPGSGPGKLWAAYTRQQQCIGSPWHACTAARSRPHTTPCRPAAPTARPPATSYGVGRRIALEHSRAVVDAIHSGEGGRREAALCRTAALCSAGQQQGIQQAWRTPCCPARHVCCLRCPAPTRPGAGELAAATYQTLPVFNLQVGRRSMAWSSAPCNAKLFASALPFAEANVRVVRLCPPCHSLPCPPGAHRLPGRAAGAAAAVVHVGGPRGVRRPAAPACGRLHRQLPALPGASGPVGARGCAPAAGPSSCLSACLSGRASSTSGCLLSLSCAAGRRGARAA